MVSTRAAALAALMSWIGGTTAPAAGPAERKALFGELHMHTRYSFDAYAGTAMTPGDAYEFAKGKPWVQGGQTYRLTQPLDFMAVTDHAFFLGSFVRMSEEGHPYAEHPLARSVLSDDPAERRSVFGKILAASRAGQDFHELMLPEVQKESWERIVAFANEHYEPGVFTTLIGYEWTATPDGRNLHRNVIFKGDTAPVPLSRHDTERPEDLWEWMDRHREGGHEALAIPHNSNLSDGIMFERVDSQDRPLTAEYAEQRMRNEPLVEVTQQKGQSETHPSLSPNDEFADFWLHEYLVGSRGEQEVTEFAGGYVRDAYRTGLELQDELGFNPYRFGLVAATDSHSGRPSAERLPPTAARPEVYRINANTRTLSGLTGLWAERNDRTSVFEALRRRETWGTTGPRIRARFFGSFDADGVDPERAGWVEKAYACCVPMGTDLPGDDQSGPPSFVVWAIKDPEGAHLDRIQIVKGWSENGESAEQVYDVVGSGDRRRGADGKLPAVGTTVDLAAQTYDNSIGAAELQGVWTDPDFDPRLNAFYYVRVLEIPTPMGPSRRGDRPATAIQERAYTSPIWYVAP